MKHLPPSAMRRLGKRPSLLPLLPQPQIPSRMNAFCCADFLGERGLSARLNESNLAIHGSEVERRDRDDRPYWLVIYGSILSSARGSMGVVADPSKYAALPGRWLFLIDHADASALLKWRLRNVLARAITIWTPRGRGHEHFKGGGGESARETKEIRDGSPDDRCRETPPSVGLRCRQVILSRNF